MNYKGFNVKKPVETIPYDKITSQLISKINNMVKLRFKEHKNKIILKTDIKGKFPLANINHIAGPLVEYWADGVFEHFVKDKNNKFLLVNIDVGLKRTDLADVILQFKMSNNQFASANVDVKSTVDGVIKKSGRSPNITSFAKIRTAYVKDPNFLFVILSIRYYPFTETDKGTGCAIGILEMTDFNTYDFKKLSSDDFDINPALGTGQIQIKDIHYVKTVPHRTAWQLIQLLDDKYIESSKHTFRSWLKEAQKHKWIE